MKLPYIKVEFREEETGAPGKFSPALVVGFGLHWAWVYLFMFNGQYLLFPEAGSLQTLLAAVSGACHAAALLAYGLFLKQARNLFDTPQSIRRNRMVAALMVTVATLLCLLGNSAGMSAVAVVCFFVAGAASGVGSAVLLMSFGVSFSVCDLPTIALCAGLSVPVGALAFAGVITVGSVFPVVGTIVLIALPFVELSCLNRCSAELVDKLEFAYLTMPVRTASFAGRIGVPSIVLGVLLGVLRTCALTGTSDNPFAPNAATANLFSSAVFAASLLTCLALILATLALRKSRNFAFRVLVPLIGVLLALLCSPWGDDAFFRCFALFASYFMLEICLWVMYSDIAQSYRVSAFVTFGFGHGLLSTGSLLGFLAMQPGYPLESVVHDPVGLVLIGLVALTLGVAVLPNGAELRSTLIRGRFCPLFVDDIEEIMGGREYFEGIEDNPDVALSSHGHESLSQTQEAGEGKPYYSELAAEECLSESDRRLGVDAPAIHESVAPRISNNLADIEARNAEDGAQQVGWFKRKCAAVADTFLLSRKETEVLFLLAKGRNSAAIQESLYISAGTANTHMRHIYRKLNVHSQHELIELVESMEID